MATEASWVHSTRRAPDWVVAAVAGFAAGAVLMVLDILWSSIVVGGGPWQTSHMIAPIFLGRESVPTEYEFSLGVVAIALATHYVLGVVFGLILAAFMVPLGLDATAGRALGTGAVFGAGLYAVNFFGLSYWFPWLASLRGWPTLAAHLVFGVTVALLYWKLQRTPKPA